MTIHVESYLTKNFYKRITSTYFIISLLLFKLIFSISSFAQSPDTSIINNSFIAFTIREKNLIPENIAYYPKDQSFYIGSTHQRKIVKVSPEKSVSDFVHEAQDGQWMVVGMKVDSVRQELWFCSSVGDVMKGYKEGEFGKHTGIFKYNLTTGKLIKKYILEEPGKLHFFNDLVLNRQGDLFFTDMTGNCIRVIRKATDEMSVLATAAGFTDPNGICISPDEQMLFVAYNEGIGSINISTGKIELLKNPSGISSTGIDGLYFYKNSLIAVQNSKNRIMQYNLNEGLNEISRYRILEANHPFFSMNPTTGAIVGNRFYYIANSQFGSFDNNHQILPDDKLYEVIILELDLEKK